MIISQAQAISYAAAAGFSGNALNIIIAIAQAESSLNTAARHINGDSSVDRGIVQINSRWHSEVSDSCAYDPGCAFKAAYKISSSGSNFTPWSTYTGGAYLRFLPGGGSSQTPAPGGQPWYTYPRVDAFGTIDPQGNYWKPDSNIQTPPGYAVTAVSPGTITNVQRTSWGQTVVTEKLDQPFNSLANHEFFEHMNGATVTTGQRVTPGTLIGHANQSGEGAPLGFGFYPGDVYGSGPEWAIEQKDLAPGGAGLLNPTNFLNSLSTGAIPLETNITGVTTTTTDHTPTPLSQRVNDTLSSLPGFAGLAVVLDEVEQFPGVIWYNPGTSVAIVPGGSLGDVINGAASAIFDPQDYVGAAIRSVLDTVWSNVVPFMVRSLIVGAGLLLIGGLIWNAVNASGIIQQGESLAKVAAVV